jgi:sugar phosphate isomerase/epimerase
MHAPIFPKFVEGEITERMTEMSHDSLRIAGVMGVPWVVWEPDVTAGDYGDEHRKEVFRMNYEFFAPLVDTAEKHDTGVCLENVPDCMGSSRGCPKWVSSHGSELCELVDGFQSSRVGVCWDTGHAHMQGLEQGGELRTLGERLKMLHIQDNNGKADQHLLPFMGTVDWKDIMDALYDINYAGDFTYEVHNAIRHLPDTLKDPMMKYAVALGKTLIDRNF